MKFQNQREFHRINFSGKTSLQFIDNSYESCQIKNLSLTGMFVLGNFKHQREENCLVRLFHEENSGDNSLRASGEVVWNNGEGAGLRFTSMTFENYMLLQTTLINKANKPIEILRELPENCPFDITIV